VALLPRSTEIQPLVASIQSFALVTNKIRATLSRLCLFPPDDNFSLLGGGKFGVSTPRRKRRRSPGKLGFPGRAPAPKIWGFRAAPKVWGSRRPQNLGFPCGAQNLGFPCGAQGVGFPGGAQNLGFPGGAQNLGFPCGAQGVGFQAAPKIWGFRAAPKVWGSRRRPKFGVSVRRPRCGVSRRRPKFGVSVRRPRCGVSRRRPKFGVSTRRPRCGVSRGRPKFGVSVRRPRCGVSRRRPKFGVSTRRPKFGVSTRRPRCGVSRWRPKFGASTRRPSCGVCRRRPKFGASMSRPRFGVSTRRPRFGASMSRPKYGVSTRRPKFGASAGRKICWGLQVAPKPGETWGFYVAPRRQSRGKLGVSMWHPDRNRRRPSLGNLGFPSRATTETDGAEAWEAWGFHVAPLMEPRVSAFYGTRETRGTWDFHDDANQLASLGNLGCFETAAQVWGTRCFHVAAHPESPESLWNFIFPCRGATKSRQSPGNSGCLFRGAMKTATQVSGRTLGFHFASQQKFLPKSGKRGVRTCGSVSPRRCEVRTLRPKCGKGHKYNAH
jgi:hypothetical protein